MAMERRRWPWRGTGFIRDTDHILRHTTDPKSRVSHHQKNRATNLENGNELTGVGLQLETPVYNINS